MLQNKNALEKKMLLYSTSYSREFVDANKQILNLDAFFVIFNIF